VKIRTPNIESAFEKNKVLFELYLYMFGFITKCVPNRFILFVDCVWLGPNCRGEEQPNSAKCHSH